MLYQLSYVREAASLAACASRFPRAQRSARSVAGAGAAEALGRVCRIPGRKRCLRRA